VIIADTSGLYAIFNRRQPEHRAARAAVQHDGGPLVLSPLVLAELDCFVLARLGASAGQKVLAELKSPAYRLAAFTDDDFQLASEAAVKYGDMELGADRRVDRGAGGPAQDNQDLVAGPQAFRRGATPDQRRQLHLAAPRRSILTSAPAGRRAASHGHQNVRVCRPAVQRRPAVVQFGFRWSDGIRCAPVPASP
jgi:predicted nucleic acid-binding protein